MYVTESYLWNRSDMSSCNTFYVQKTEAVYIGQYSSCLRAGLSDLDPGRKQVLFFPTR